MYIKISKDGIKTEWLKCISKKDIKYIVSQSPEKISIRLGDYYENSPNADEEIEVTLDVFLALADEFVKKEDAQRKWQSAHVASRTVENIEAIGITPVNYKQDEFQYADFNSILQSALEKIPEKAKNRWLLYNIHGYTMPEIALYEGVSKEAIYYSIQNANEKIRKYYL